jgi:hypothetical protein
MAGGSGPRNVNSRYQRPREDARENSSDERRQRLRRSSSGSGSGSTRGRPPLARPRPVPEEVCRTTDSSGDDQVGATHDEGDALEDGEGDALEDGEGDALEDGETAGGSTATAAAKPYLRGPSKLPGPLLPPLRPVIRPQGDR